MGEETLASFFHKVQAVEESFLLLEEKERSRALNILQSSINKLLNFVGDTDHVNAVASTLDKTYTGVSTTTNSFSLASCSSQADTKKKKQKTNNGRKKVDGQSKRRGPAGGKDCAVYAHDNVSDKMHPTEHMFVSNNADRHARMPRGHCGLGKHKDQNKGNFEDDDFQELAAFDCSYDFNHTLQPASSNAVSRTENRHVAQCGGKLSGKMLSISASAPDGIVCTSSGAQPPYPGQLPDVVASGEENQNACEISHSQYQGAILSGANPEMEANCHMGHASQYGAPQIMPGTQMDSSADAAQYAGGVIDPNAGPSEYAGGVIDSSGDPAQYANGVIDGGVIDSSGDPSQYGGSVIDASGEPSQFSGTVMEGGGEGAQYAGSVIGMSGAQDIQNCNTHYTGAMIPTAQDVTVCTTSQYAGTVLAMSMPETVSYSAAHYAHTVMQGINCSGAHPHFAGTILDMSAASGRPCDGNIAMPQPHPAAQYAGTIFEGAIIGGASCSQFAFRRPMFETHEAFQRSQELTQSLMQASVLQQQQLYHLQQSQAGRWRVFMCRTCGECLTHYRSVRAHLLTHGSSPLSCRFCRQRHVNALALMHHLCGGQNWQQTAYVSREIFMCHECCRLFTSKLKLKVHFETEHGSDMPQNIKYICRFCGLQLGSKKAIFVHYRHHAGCRFVCQLCGAFLNDFIQFANHMYQHERHKLRMVCQQCGQVFFSFSRFQKHVKTHPGHTCYMCQKTFSSAVPLLKHQSKVHHVKVSRKVMRLKMRGGHQCGVCWKRFPKARDLEKHSLLHSGEKPLHCALCKLSFGTTKALAKHRQTLGHSRRTGKAKEHQHLCSECGKAYFRRQALQRHLKQHKSSKPFACQHCSFRCGENDSLQRHVQRHFSTQRNFICELCGAAFHAKKTLEIHHSYKHSSERRFKCSECPMTFKARNALGRHAKTHCRTREHACWCGAAFNRLYNLRRHMRLVHGSDEALPPLRRVEVLDSNQSTKEAVITPPARKMLVKTRKVKADCMQKEQEAAAAALVVGGGEEGGGERGGGVENDGVLQHVGGMGSLAAQGMDGVDQTYSTLQSAAGGAGTGGMILPPSQHPHHLTMEQSYAMVSATLHQHNLHSHHHPHAGNHPPTAGHNAPGADPPTPLAHHHPFSHLSHPPLDYSQLPALSSLAPYPSSLPPPSSNAASVATTAANAEAPTPRQDFYPSNGVGMDGGMQQASHQQQQQQGSVGDGYTTSPFSFIQNFLLPSVGVPNLLDLAHASGAK